ncbi:MULTISPECIES: hypothetical protein [unclassified Nocardioides]|uniref:hypothetical protein n=1 Tax=unclassified Nocardioides TaxID=2615069 RepID=UPI0009F0CD42|nr:MULTISPECIES: hypothetical protein [unclassified Nocardioides]GAW51347.1 predicted protein [Nocardioides sp. PD653-B2]GAW52694.1 Predicted protein [Nocardioides sp. PD653]
MGRARYDATSRGAAALAGLAAAALAVLTPTLGTAGPATLSLAVVTLLVAALVGLGDRGAVLAACFVGSAPRIDDAEPRTVSGRPTDPTHHPLRPRAPGSA